MRYTNIELSVDESVARLVLKRPEKLNSLNNETMIELRDAVDRVENDQQLRVLVITGAGRAFCAGQDLDDPFMHEIEGQRPDIGDIVERHYKPLVMRLQNLRIPTIAAVNGLAAGAGASLALTCDLVLAAHSAYFVQAFSKLGLTPDTGATWYLSRFVGTARALGLAMLADKLPAVQAVEWGLIWKAVEDEHFEEAVNTLANQLARMPTKALARTRHLVQAAAVHTLEQQLSMEAVVIREMGWTLDYQEGRNAFLEKRAARFTGK